MQAQDIFTKLRAYQEREKRTAWEGTFAGYLELLLANPAMAQLSHARIYNMVLAAGVDEHERGRRRYTFFDQELFGLDATLAHLVEDYFRPASRRLDVRKRILLLVGPVGGGKSTLVNLLKRGMEEFSKTEAGALYVIDGCPMHEEPLHLLPKDVRQDLFQETGLHVEGGLCPWCRWQLKETYQGKFDEVKVRRVVFSEENRVGIGTFKPKDPKCVTGDTLLMTDAGMLRFDEIQASVQASDDQFVPFALDVSTRDGQMSTSFFYNGGRKPTRRVRTRLGYEIEGSFKHPVLVMRNGVDSWTRLEDVKVGDYVALQRGSHLFGSETLLPAFDYQGPASKGRNVRLTFPTHMTDDLARFLGYVVAEGSLTDTALWITNKDRRILDELHTLIERLFGLPPMEYVKPKGEISSVTISSVKLVQWLEQVCGIRRGAANKTIPLCVRRAPKLALIAFLEGLFWGDAHVSARPSKKSNVFKFTSASSELVRQVQVALLNLGVVSATYPQVMGTFASVAMQVCGDEVVNLLEQMPAVAGKCADGVQAILPRRGFTGVDTAPGLHAAIKAVITDVPYGQRGNLSRFIRYTSTDETYGRKPSYGMLGTIVEEGTRAIGHRTAALEALQARIDRKTLWLEVRRITEDEAQVYDLTVPDSHSFCANGFINHNSQDVADLTGSVNLNALVTYGQEADPRAYNFDGELNISNRGLLEMVEMLKNEKQFLYELNTVAGEQLIKAGRFAEIYVDVVPIGHTNEYEFNSYFSNKENEAMIDRMFVVTVPYNLRVDAEQEIYRKLVAQSDLREVHVAPHTYRIVSIFAILSRLIPSKKAGVGLMTKLRLYAGEDVGDFKQKDVKELREEYQHEGMEGVSPRFVMTRLSAAIVKDGTMCLNPIDALRALRDGVHEIARNDEERKRLLGFIDEARKEYDETAKKEVQKAFVYSYDEAAHTLLNNYLDNVEAFCNSTKLKDPITDEEMAPDEKLMRSIEEQIGVSENAKKEFRDGILKSVGVLARKGKQFTFESDERLKQAIEKKLFADLRDVVKITTSSRTPDVEQLKRINSVVERLVQNEGYCAICANELVKYVGALLSR